jgi:hypothetical protein
MTSKILATSVLALIFAGCANPGGSSSSTGSTNAPRVPTAGAERVAGDFVPNRLVSVAIPAPTEMETLRGSSALAPAKAFSMEQPALPVTAHDLHKTMKGDPRTFLIAIDNPIGARVIVHPLDPSLSLPTVHLVDVVTGARLDMARDETNDINVVHDTHAQPTSDPSVLRDGTGTPAPMAVGGALRREPGFEPLLVNSRVLSVDRAFISGMVRVEVPPAMAASGISVEVQQPKSHITITAVTDQLNHAFGDTAEIHATLMNDNRPIVGGTVDGIVELPGHEKLPILQFTSEGNGSWVAHLPLSSADPKYIGVWGVKVHAAGSDNGIAFERDVETAMGYYPSHAHITALGQPVISRGGDHLIDAVSVDADIETLVDDRFSIRGTLTYTAADGTEHPLAEAQTGQLVHKGNGTITLTFDNAAIALAGVDGPFHLRDIRLVSQGFGLTQHRLGRALDLQTSAIHAAEIRYPKQIPLQAQDLIANGDLKARK